MAFCTKVLLLGRKILRLRVSSVVEQNPDPVGSKNFSKIWIRIRKNHSGSESEQLRIRNEFEVKLH
jgi:hypothetical protein